MATNTFEIPLIQPLRFFQQTDLTNGLTTADIDLGGFNIQYNSRPFDKDFFIRNLKEWQDKVKYIQPFQIGDIVPIYVRHDNSVSDYTINILDEDTNIIKVIPYTDFTTFSVGGVVGFYYELGMYDLGVGTYFSQIKYDGPGEDIYFISEPFEVKIKHVNTLLLEYNNSYNDHNVIFEQTGLKFQLRVRGALVDVTPKAKVETYEAQKLALKLLDGKPIRDYNFVFGGDGKQIPDYMADKLNRAFCLDNLRLDSTYYTRQDEGDLSPSRTVDYPLSEWSITLRDRDNPDSVELDFYAAIDHVFGDAPKGDRFYLKGLSKTSGSDVFDRDFEGVKAFCSFLTKYLNDTYTLTGYVTISSENEIIYRKSGIADHSWFNTENPVLDGVLENWLGLGIDTTVTPTLEFQSGILEYDAVIWGDGSKRSYGNLGGSHVYSNVGIVTCYYYFNDQVDLTAFTTTSDGIISISGGDIVTTLEELIIENEKLKYADNTLFLQSDGAFDNLSLEGNTLPVAQINKIIVMLQDALINNKIASTGNAGLNLQTPLAPPSSGSFSFVLATLRNSWTIDTD